MAPQRLLTLQGSFVSLKKHAALMLLENTRNKANWKSAKNKTKKNNIKETPPKSLEHNPI